MSKQARILVEKHPPPPQKKMNPNYCVKLLKICVGNHTTPEKLNFPLISTPQMEKFESLKIQ